MTGELKGVRGGAQLQPPSQLEILDWLELKSNRNALRRFDAGEVFRTKQIRFLVEAGLIRLECEWRDRKYVITELGHALLKMELPEI